MKNSKIKSNERNLLEKKEKDRSKFSKVKDANHPSRFKRDKSLQKIESLYKDHVKKVNLKYKKLAKSHPNKNYEYSKYLDLKRCETCTDFINDKDMLLCDICDDGYHYYCLNLSKDKITENFYCPKCIKELPQQKKKCFKQTSIDEVFQPRETIIKNRNCNECEKNIKSYSFKNCIKCRKDFHLKCFIFSDKNSSNKNNSKIVCFKCEENIQNIIKSTKISDFFKNEKKITPLISDKTFSDGSTSKSSFKNSDNNTEYLKTKFKIFKKLSRETKERLNKSLLRALLAKNIKFDDDLYYDNVDIFPNNNDSSLESGIQKISNYNLEIYNKFKENTRIANYPGIEIFEDENQGFIVKAIEDIPVLTLLCEYSGEVHFSRKKLFDNNDSIMDLIRTPFSSTSLVIAPETRGNIARFLSGINNNDKNKKKQNVNSLRLDINGSVHVLLYAAKKIKKNEILYYDYNAGGYSGYPTENFI